MTINDAVSALLVRFGKENTKASYQTTFDAFQEIFGARDVSDILPAEIRDFLREMPVSTATRYLRLCHLRSLFNEAIRSLKMAGETPAWSHPCELLEDDFPAPKYRPKAVSDTIHEDMSTARGSLRLKHQLIFDLGTRGALRVSEILHFTPGDLISDGEACAVRINSPKSGHNQSYRVLPADLCAALWDYIAKKDIKPNMRVFPITRQAVYRVLKARGIEPHDLRRYAAYRASEQGKDINTIKGLLDHASIATTARYVGSLSVKKLAENLKGM